MAMGPIEIVTMQRMADVSQVRHQENIKPITEQVNIQTQFDKQVQHLSEQVVNKTDPGMGNEKYDAKEKGKNEYHKDGIVKIKKKDGTKEVVPTDLDGDFDISV